MKILKSILNYIPLATFLIFVVTDGIFSLTSALIFVIYFNFQPILLCHLHNIPLSYTLNIFLSQSRRLPPLSGGE